MYLHNNLLILWHCPLQSNLLEANTLLEGEDLGDLDEGGGVLEEVDGHIAGQAALTVQVGRTVTQRGHTLM